MQFYFVCCGPDIFNLDWTKINLVHQLSPIKVSMPTQLIVNVHDAKTHFSKLLERAHTGQEVILAKAGKPYARLMPLAPVSGKRQPGRLVGMGCVGSAFFEPLPDAELAAWEQR